jgi:hypothetical protein
VLTAGTCQGKFVATVSGGKGLPITLQGSSTTVFTTAGGYGLHLKASYWKLTGFTVQKAQKGHHPRGHVHPVECSLRIAALGQGQQLLHFLAQLRLDLVGVRPRQGLVLAGVGLDLGAVQRDVPQA